MRRKISEKLLICFLIFIIVLLSFSLSSCKSEKDISAVSSVTETAEEPALPESEIAVPQIEASETETVSESEPAAATESVPAAPAPTPYVPPAPVVFNYELHVNRTKNTVTVYGKDDAGNFTVPVKAMVCSVGLNFQTPVGTFNTQNKYVWRKLEGGVYGQYATRITGSILFHSVPYFSQNKGDLEYEQYNLLGSDASLGCVRLAVADAKWIYDNCPLGTTVIIYDSEYDEPLGKPAPALIDVTDGRCGWDPTDPDPANPWNAG